MGKFVYYAFIDADVFGIYRGIVGSGSDFFHLAGVISGFDAVWVALGNAEFLHAFPMWVFSVDFIRSYIMRHDGGVCGRCLVVSTMGDVSTMCVLNLNGGDDDVPF